MRIMIYNLESKQKKFNYFTPKCEKDVQSVILYNNKENSNNHDKNVNDKF